MSVTLDHFDPSFAADPYATWDALRATGPVWYWADLDSFVVVDHRLARDVLRDGDTFTLSRFAWEHWVDGGDGVERPLLDVTIDDGIFQAGPADHSRLRKLVVPTFSPSAAERHRPLIEEVIDDLTASWSPGDVVDLAADLALIAPVRIISRLLGVDPSRDEWFTTMAGDLAALADPTAGPDVFDRAEVQLGHFRDLLEAAGTSRGLYAELAAAQEDGERLTATECFSMLVGLMTAGMETTASAISLGAMALMAHPDQAELLRAAPERWPAAVIELLRYSYIGYGLTRFPTRAVELGGHPVRAGQLVWVNVGAALHDPSTFPDPERLDIGRDNTEAIPFGFGAHYCLGASLAKVEIESALRSLTQRFPDMAPVGEPSWRTHMLLRGPTSLPVRL
ncbi:MAG: cytochrome P450 [Acidimicrobiales bacterium]